MPSSHRTQVVRDRITAVFADQGPAAKTELREAMLIRDGHFCGRRFTQGDLSAIWFFEEDQIKVYGSDGRLLETTQLAEFTAPDRPIAA